MASLLKRITNRAKEIRRRSGGSWKAALKKAGSEFKGMKSTPAKRRSVTRKKVRGVATVSKSHVDKNKITNNFQIGSVASHISAAKKLIADKIADKERLKFLARLKSDKRRIGKEISELKKQYRKLK